jgi:hypothetical protein
MMRREFLTAAIIISFILFFPSASSGFEQKSRFSTIIYESEDLLKKFNREVSLGRLSYLLGSRKSLTIEEEVRNKIDVVVERVRTILEMYPKELHFTIVLLPSAGEVRKTFRNKFGRNTDFIAFYSPRDKIIFISVKDVDLGILAHEIAHVVIDEYYGIATPAKIHEVLAQYVETHLKD